MCETKRVSMRAAQFEYVHDAPPPRPQPDRDTLAYLMLARTRVVEGRARLGRLYALQAFLSLGHQFMRDPQ
jgi:hypothetical protein